MFSLLDFMLCESDWCMHISDLELENKVGTGQNEIQKISSGLWEAEVGQAYRACEQDAWMALSNICIMCIKGI